MTLLSDAVLAPVPGSRWEDLPLPRGFTPPVAVGELLKAAGDAPGDALASWLALDAAGRLELRLPTEDAALSRLLAAPGARAAEPGLAYVATYEGRWASDRALFDFVGADDYNGRLKAFERDIYLRHLEPSLAALRPGAAVLDAGCGVGRFSDALLRRGLRVTGLDASPSALKAAARHVLAAGGAERFSVRLGDARRMTGLPDGAFDAALALELVCYHPDADASLGELRRVLAPGGLLFVSVEGHYGARLREGASEELFVRYYDPASLTAALEAAGFGVLSVVGTHYVPEGPLDHLVDEDALGDPARRAALLERELASGSDPALATQARAWLATARRRG